MTKFDRFQHEYDTIIVGSTLPALLYANFWNIPFLSGKLEPPDKYECFVLGTDLVDYGLYNCCKKYLLWDQLYFQLGIRGLNLTGDKGQLVRILDEIIKVPISNTKMARFKYNKLLIFSETNVHGLPPYTHVLIDPLFKVIDHFEVKADPHIETIGRARYPLELGRAFIEHLMIGKPTIGISYLSQQDLTSHDFSEVSARFKVLQMLRDAGFKGKRNGKDPNRKDGWSRYALKVVHTERHARLICRNHTYQDTERVEFKHDSDVELLKIFSA